MTIDEGEPVRITEVSFVGFEVIPERHLTSVREGMPLKAGAPRVRADVTTTHELAINELRDHGYPYAKVDTEEKAESPKQVAVVFTARPGTLAHFGEVEVAGNKSVSGEVVERLLAYEPGDLYRRSVVQDAQRQLYGMQLFQFVNVELLNPEEERSEVRTRVTVAEGKHQRVNFGVGYGTEEKARVDGEYRHVNFLGGARTAGVHARWSSLDRGVRLTFNQPYLFTPLLSLGGDAQQWYTFTPAYRSVVIGGKATVAQRLGSRNSWSVSYTNEFTSSSISNEALDDLSLRNELIALGLDPTTGKQEGTLNAIGLDAQRSTADNVLNATRGYQIALHAEQAGRGLPGTFNYFALSVDGRHYLPVNRRLVIANRLQIGNIDASQGLAANVPFSKKYFLGGATSVRGWGRYEISPLSGSGLPLGGNSMLAFSSEVRAALRGSLGGVVFVDGGNVWADAWTITLGELRYAAGLGLRYRTPVGPIRLDAGYQLNRLEGLLVDGKPESRRWRLHFSIGQAF